MTSHANKMSTDHNSFRDDIMLTDQTLRKKPSTSGKIKLYDRWHRLQAKLKTFHEMEAGYWANIDWDEISLQPQAVQDNDNIENIGDIPLEEDDIGDAKDDDSDDDDEEDDVSSPEQVHLLMPSSLGAEECCRQGLTSLMDQEIQLREGQANDALEELRMALANLTLLLQTRRNVEHSQHTETQIWDDIQNAKGAVRRHVRSYCRAHQALINLDADKDQFLPIFEEDLRLSGDVLEENRIGQKSDTLAWFWRIGGGGEKEQQSEWMQECKNSF